MKPSIKVAAVAVAVVVAGSVAGWKWWQSHSTRLPEGFVSSNGRLEAKEVDIATKFAGRIGAVLVEEGDTVKAGQVVVRMDVADLQADLRKAEAEIRQAQKANAEAAATVEHRQSECKFAASELKRALFLVQKGHISSERLEQRITEKEQADAACTAAKARLGDTKEAIAAAVAQAEGVKTDIAESVLRTPRSGRFGIASADRSETAGSLALRSS